MFETRVFFLLKVEKNTKEKKKLTGGCALADSDAAALACVGCSSAAHAPHALALFVDPRCANLGGSTTRQRVQLEQKRAPHARQWWRLLLETPPPRLVAAEVAEGRGPWRLRGPP